MDGVSNKRLGGGGPVDGSEELDSAETRGAETTGAGEGATVEREPMGPANPYEEDTFEDASAYDDPFGYEAEYESYAEANLRKEAAVSLHELQAQQAQPEAEAAPDPNATRTAGHLETMLQEVDVEGLTNSYEAGSILEGHVLDKTGGRETLRQWADQPEKLDALMDQALAQRTDLPADPVERREVIAEIKASIRREVEERVVGDVTTKIADRAASAALKSAEMLDTTNATSQTRREFVAGFARATGDAAAIEEALVKTGFDEDAAAEIAQVAAELHDDPAKMQAFLSGATGEGHVEVAGVAIADGEYVDVEQAVKDNLSELSESMKSLADRAQNNTVGIERMLTDPAFGGMRDQVFAQEGIDPTNPQNGLDDTFARAMARAEAEEESQQNQILAANIIIAAGTFGIGGVAGLGVGGASAAVESVATAGIQAAVDISLAQHEVTLANAATADVDGGGGRLADDSYERDAAAQRDLAVASGLASVALAGVANKIDAEGGKVFGQDLADVQGAATAANTSVETAGSLAED